MKKTISTLFFLLPVLVIKGQSYLNQLYGIPENPNIDIGEGAYELEDSSFLFFYTNTRFFEQKSNIRVGRISHTGESIFDKAIEDSTGNTAIIDATPASDGNFMICGNHVNSLTDTTSFYLTKINSNGEALWSKIYSTQDYQADCIVVWPTQNGGYLLGGQQVMYNPNPVPGHALLICTDSSGQELWRKTYGVDNWQEVIKSIAPTPDGGFLMAGYAIYPFGSFIEFQGLLIKIDSVGNEQWMQRYGQGDIGEAFTNIQSTIDGHYLVTTDLSYTPGISPAVGAFWLLKFDVDGNILWERKYRDHGPYTWAQDFVELTDGSIVAAGATRNIPTQSQSGFLIKISAEGDSLWSHIYDRNPDYIDLFYSISGTMDGGFVMSGFARQPDGSSQDVWILKVDSVGCAVSGCFAVDVEEPPVVVEGKLEVWPNPFDGLLRVRLPAPMPGMPAHLRLYALSGQLLWEHGLPPGVLEMQANLDFLLPGVYFLRYEREDGPPLGTKVVKVR